MVFSRKRRETGQVRKAARKEFLQFRREICRKGKRRIWEDSRRIHFYCSIMEYFQYSLEEEQENWDALFYVHRPIQAMWRCYLSDETLDYTTWPEIRKLLRRMKQLDLEDGDWCA